MVFRRIKRAGCLVVAALLVGCGTDIAPGLEQDGRAGLDGLSNAALADGDVALADEVDGVMGDDGAAGPDTVDSTETVDASLDAGAETVDAAADAADTSPEAVDPPDVAADATDTGAPLVDPGMTGSWAITTSDVKVAGFDGRWFLPTSTTQVPAIVLAPGFSLDAATLGWLASHLASHGVAVLTVDFGDSAFAPLTHDALGAAMIEALTWMAADARIDATRLGLGGHSRGGKAAMLAASRDNRAKVVVGLDPVDAPPPLTQPNADYPSVTPELMGTVTAALLLLGSEYGATPIFPVAPECAPTAENYAQYAANASAASRVKVELIPKSGHNDFADPLSGGASFACPAGDVPATTRARTKTLAAAFLHVMLRGDARYESHL